MSGTYDDIICLPHHVSARHSQMPIHDRAAQFSPFAALTGYDAAVKESARLTDSRIELDESAKEQLDRALRAAAESKAPVRVTYFLPDDRKAGGAYVNTDSQVKKLNTIDGVVLLNDGTVILLENVINVEVLA